MGASGFGFLAVLRRKGKEMRFWSIWWKTDMKMMLCAGCGGSAGGEICGAGRDAAP